MLNIIFFLALLFCFLSTTWRTYYFFLDGC